MQPDSLTLRELLLWPITPLSVSPKEDSELALRSSLTTKPRPTSRPSQSSLRSTEETQRHLGTRPENTTAKLDTLTSTSALLWRLTRSKQPGNANTTPSANALVLYGSVPVRDSMMTKTLRTSKTSERTKPSPRTPVKPPGLLVPFLSSVLTHSQAKRSNASAKISHYTYQICALMTVKTAPVKVTLPTVRRPALARFLTSLLISKSHSSLLRSRKEPRVLLAELKLSEELTQFQMTRMTTKHASAITGRESSTRTLWSKWLISGSPRMPLLPIL